MKKQTNIYNIKLLILLIYISLCFSTKIAVPDHNEDTPTDIKLIGNDDPNYNPRQKFFDEMNSHANAEITKNGFKKEQFMQHTTNKFYKRYAHDNLINMHVYSKHEGTNVNLAYEVYPLDPKAKNGKTDNPQIINLNNEADQGSKRVTIKGNILTIFMVPKNIFKLNLRVGDNDCLGFNTFYSDVENLPSVKVSENPKFVDLDLKNEKESFDNSTNLGHYMNDMDSGFVYLDDAGRYSEEFFLTLFCPFWMDKETAQMEVKLELVYLQDLPFYFGRVFRFSIVE